MVGEILNIKTRKHDQPSKKALIVPLLIIGAGIAVIIGATLYLAW